MKTLKNILVVVEPLLKKQTVLDRASQLARATDATLHLYAAGYHDVVELISIFNREENDGIKHQYVEAQVAHLEDLAKPLREAGLTVEVGANWSRPVENAIVEKVKSLRPELVMVASHSRNELDGGHDTHTDLHLIKQTEVPLWIVQLEQWDESSPIVACIDPKHIEEENALDESMLDHSLGLSQLLKNPVKVFHAFGVYKPVMGLNLSLLAERVENFQKQIQANVHQLASARSIETDQVQFVEGPFLPSFRRYEKEVEPQLVVLGCRHSSKLAELVSGLTAQKIASEINSDILVIK